MVPLWSSGLRASAENTWTLEWNLEGVPVLISDLKGCEMTKQRRRPTDDGALKSFLETCGLDPKRIERAIQLRFPSYLGAIRDRLILQSECGTSRWCERNREIHKSTTQRDEQFQLTRWAECL
jgi:hypothetical protein